ncbi:MAG: uroporphyrinogen decarboxylase family protein [Lachnospiraceae bacterium]|nr:uroporphyrinogen decarboxylase family protein [Lachnospiraceae bacterium]
MNYRITEPNIENLFRMFRREPVEKVPFFELFMDYPVYEYFAGRTYDGTDELEILKLTVDAFYNIGCDYATTFSSDFAFPRKQPDHGGSGGVTVSLNDGNTITDRESFEAYKWPDPWSFDCSRLEKIRDYLPKGMKLAVWGPESILESVTALVGYDNLCYMLVDDPELLQDIFDKVGEAVVGYYEQAVTYDTVGFLISNDDWGFNTQTFLSVEDLRKYVFPWHKKIVEVAHKHGKPIILHSCGYMNDVMDDIIDEMKYDGKHSFEDNILSVEDSYRRWGDRIAILGGVDLQYLSASTEEEIKERCKKLYYLTKDKGGYALGTGNSMVDYLDPKKYIAMLEAWREVQSN